MGTSATEVERLIQTARLHLAQGELHEAAGRSTEAIRLDGKQSASYLVRAEAHRRLKRPERALADLAVAIRLDPQQPGPYVIRAEILKRRCQFDQAIADATTALMLDPRNAAAYAIRAQCRYAIGDHEGAREDVQEMLLIDPTRPVPDLRAGAVSDPSPSMAADDERFWKQTGGGNREDERAMFADGKPVDKTYRSRPPVSDEDAPEVLGVSSGYKPGVLATPIPRMRGRVKKPLGHGGGGAILMLGVAMVTGLALWLGFRGTPGPDPSTRSATPHPSSVVESDAPQPIPASTKPEAAESAGWRASTPAKPLDLKPVVRDLGSFSLTKDGRSWVVVMPERFTRAELAFYRGTPDHPTLNAAYAGHLQINGRDVVRFTGTERDGTFIFHDYTSDTDYRAVNDYDTKPLRRHIDVTKYLQPGENRFQYYHEQRPDLPMGVVLAITPAADTDVPRSEILTHTTEVSSPTEVDLLRFADPRRAITGLWSRRGRMLAVSPNGSRPAVLPIPYAMPGEYDLEVRADSGKAGLLMIGLAHGETRFTACLSTANGKYWLQEFDGQPMQDNESTRRGPVFRDGEGITVRCSVRDEGVVISCRGQRLIDWKGDYARFTARPLALVEIPDKQALFLASWVQCRFTACRLTPVPTGEAHGSGTRAVTPGSPEGAERQSDRIPGEIRRFEGHTGVILGVAFSPDGKWAASSGDTTVRLWKVSDLSDDAHIVLAAQEPQTERFIAVAFSPDGKTLAASGFDGRIALWDMTASPPRRLRVLHGHGDPVVALAFSPDGQTLVTGGRNDGLVRFWDMAHPAATPRTTIPPEKNGVWSLAYSPDGKTLAEGVSFPRPGKPSDSARPGEIWLWDVGRRPYVKRAVVKEARKVPRSLAYSPDGSRLAFGDGDVARVIDAGTGRRLGTFEGHTSFVVSVAFTPDGKRAISGGYDKAVRLWDAMTMEQVHVFDGHEGYVEQVAVSPDGRLAASCGHDKTVRLWRLSDRAD